MNARGPSALAATVLLLAAAACNDTKTNPFVEVRDPAVEAEKVRLQMVPGALNVGALISISSDDPSAAILAAEQITRAGGIGGGRPVHVVFLDSFDYPSGVFEAKVRGMVLAGVKVILTSASSDVLFTYQIASPDDVLSISGAATAPSITTLTRTADLLFRTCPSDTVQGRVIAKATFDAIVAEDPGVTPTAAVLFQSDTDYGTGLRDVFTTAFTALGGQVVRQVGFAFDLGFTEDSQNAAITAAFATGPDGKRPHRVFLAAAGDPDPGASVLISWARQGAARRATASPWVFPDALSTQFVLDNIPSSVKSALDGSLGVDIAAGTGPRFTTFDRDFAARFGHEPLPFASNAYDAIALVALAAARAFAVSGTADPSGSDLAAHLREVANAPGVAVGPGETSLAAGLTAIAAGSDIDYSGAYSAFDLDRNGDISGEAAYSIVRLAAAANTFVTVDTQTTIIPPP